MDMGGVGMWSRPTFILILTLLHLTINSKKFLISYLYQFSNYTFPPYMYMYIHMSDRLVPSGLMFVR